MCICLRPSFYIPHIIVNIITSLVTVFRYHLFLYTSLYTEKTNNQKITFSNGYLGYRNDEERSEMRYVVRIAELSESSNLWTHIALSEILREHACFSVCNTHHRLWLFFWSKLCGDWTVFMLVNLVWLTVWSGWGCVCLTTHTSAN